MFIAKEVGKTEKGNIYIILQDTPTSFHVSIQVEGVTMYEHIETPPTMEFLKEQIVRMENELINFVPNQTNTNISISTS